MRDEAYKAVVACLLLSTADDSERESAQVTLLLAHLRKVFATPLHLHDRLVQECLKYRTYVLEVTIVDIPHTKSVQLTVESGKKSTIHTLNGAETYEIDIGSFRDVDFHCQVVKLNGQKAKSVLRKTTLFKRMLADSADPMDRISVRSIPLETRVRKAFTAKGTTYHADIKITKQMSDTPLPRLDFEDLVEFVRTVHEFEAPFQKPVYSGELPEMSYSLLHLTFIFYQMPAIYLKLLSLSVFLVWDSTVSELAPEVLTNAIAEVKSHQEEPEICRIFTHCLEYLNDCLIGVIDEMLSPVAVVKCNRRETQITHTHSSTSDEIEANLHTQSTLSIPSTKPRSSSVLSTVSQRSTHSLRHGTLEREPSSMSAHSNISIKQCPPSPVLTRPSHLASSPGLLHPTSAHRKRSFIDRARKKVIERSLSLNPRPKLERVASTRSNKSTEQPKPPKRKSVTLLEQMSSNMSLELPPSLRLFPPKDESFMKEFHDKLQPVFQICALNVWDFVESYDPATFLAGKLRILIAQAVQYWVRTEFVIEAHDVHSLCTTLGQLLRAIHFQHWPYTLYFDQYSINYLRHIFETLDSPLQDVVLNVVQSATFKLNSRDFGALDAYSKSTMRIYIVLHKMRRIVRAKKISVPLLNRFEQWFSMCLVFWTTTWRETSLIMISRTAPLEEDENSKFTDSERPLPSGQYSFLCIQQGISDDIADLRLEYPQHALLCAVKMVQIFSDNLVAYARKLYKESLEENQAQRHGSAKTGGDCARCVRAVNGIDHALDYIEQHWAKFAQWERVKELIAAAESDHIHRTIEAILRSCKNQCDSVADQIVRRTCNCKWLETTRIAKQLCLDRHEYTKTLASYVRDRIDAFHKADVAIDGIEKIVDCLEKEFYPRRAKRILRTLWDVFELEVARSLREFQSDDYYRNIHLAMRVIREFLRAPKTLSAFSRTLQLKSLPTAELTLSYYVSLADLEDEQGDGATVCIQAAFLRENSDTDSISLFVKVREARIPCPLSSTPTPTCPQDTAFKLELLPKTLFAESLFPSITTKFLPICSNPKWGEAFRISIPHDSFFTNGAVLALSLLERDRIGCEHAAGKAIFALNQIREGVCRNSLPKICKPILPASAGNALEPYNVLRERVLFDKAARMFWKKERAFKDVRINLKQLREVPRRWGSLRRFGSERIGSPAISVFMQPTRTVSTI